MVDERGSREICRTANRMGIFRVIRSHCFEHAPSPFYPLQPADLSIPSHPIPSPSQFPRSCHNLITCINHPLACKKNYLGIMGGKRRVRRGNPKCYEIWFVRKSGEDLPSHGHRWGAPIGPNPTLETPPAVLGDGIPVFSRFPGRGRPLLGIRNVLDSETLVMGFRCRPFVEGDVMIHFAFL